jgi:predicted GNAT superfamily acetyltransferase
MKVPSVRVEKLTTIEQFHRCENVQRQAWRMSDDTDVIPLHLLITLQQNGGLVLGAFDEHGMMVGFLCGFLGLHPSDDHLKHCSHMMGVLPEWRGRGVGYALKRAQRDHALAQGLDLVTWTFDPLESLNAALNIGKLGAICRTYVRDLYGPMEDELNAGLPSDRFQLEWWIRSDHVIRRLAGERTYPSLAPASAKESVVLNPGSPDKRGLLCPSETARTPEAGTVLIEIPADIRSIKAADMDLAEQWRTHTRALFEHCFDVGYATTDFISETPPVAEAGDATWRSYYMLQRKAEVNR